MPTPSSLPRPPSDETRLAHLSLRHQSAVDSVWSAGVGQMSAGRPPMMAASFDEFIASLYVVITLRVNVTELHLRRTFSIAIKEADFKRVCGGKQPQAHSQ